MTTWKPGERVPVRHASVKLPAWQAQILIERHGNINAGIRACVEEAVTADVDLLDGSPTMLRLIADVIEQKRGKFGAVRDYAEGDND